MTTIVHTRRLVRLDHLEHFRVAIVRRLFFEGSGSSVTVQAFAIVVASIEFQIHGRRRSLHILNVYVTKAAQLGGHASVHGVVGVARIASLVARHSIVLIMSRGKKTRIADEAAS